MRDRRAGPQAGRRPDPFSSGLEVRADERREGASVAEKAFAVGLRVEEPAGAVPLSVGPRSAAPLSAEPLSAEPRRVPAGDSSAFRWCLRLVSHVLFSLHPVQNAEVYRQDSWTLRRVGSPTSMDQIGIRELQSRRGGPGPPGR